MRITFTLLVSAVIVAMALPAVAELQDVTIDGSIRIRGNYYMGAMDDGSQAGGMIRWNGRHLPARSIGDPVGGQTVMGMLTGTMTATTRVSSRVAPVWA